MTTPEEYGSLIVKLNFITDLDRHLLLFNTSIHSYGPFMFAFDYRIAFVMLCKRDPWSWYLFQLQHYFFYLCLLTMIGLLNLHHVVLFLVFICCWVGASFLGSLRNIPSCPFLLLRLNVALIAKLLLRLLGYLAFWMILASHDLLSRYIVTIRLLFTLPRILFSMGVASTLRWSVIFFTPRWLMV